MIFIFFDFVFIIWSKETSPLLSQLLYLKQWIHIVEKQYIIIIVYKKTNAANFELWLWGAHDDDPSSNLVSDSVIACDRIRTGSSADLDA